MVSEQQLAISRLQFFADALMVQALSNAAAIDNLDSIIRTQTQGKETERRRLRNGFKWLTGTAVYSLLEDIINSPELLGLEWDQRAWTWWRDNRYDGNSTLPSAFTNPSSHLAGVASRLFSVLSLLRTSGDSWDRMVEVSGHALSIAETLGTMALDCEVSPIRGDHEGVSVQDAVRLRAFERLLDYLKYERGKLSAAYGFVWSNTTAANEVLSGTDLFGQNVLNELETELSSLPFMPNGSNAPVEWSSGVIAGTCIAIQQLGEFEDESFDPLDAFQEFHKGDGSVIEFLEVLVKEPFQDRYLNFPSQYFGLTAPQGLTKYELSGLLGPVSRVSDAERLAALLGLENKLVASNGPLDHEQFATVISGLASQAGNTELIKVVRINHSQGDDYLNWFSVAVHVPRIGPISNASMWWVFHKIYATGSMDSICIIAEDRVNKTLLEFWDRITLDEIAGVSNGDLLALCSSPAWKFLHSYSKRLENINSDLRGAIPEMVSALLLSHKGYQNIKANFKPSALGGRELDAAGVLPTDGAYDCLVIEAKGSAETDEDLENEIKEFSAKIKDLKNRLPQFSQDLGFPGEIKSISALFVSMAELRHYERDSYGIELWDYERFQEELRAAGVSENYRNLLEKTSIAFVMRDLWGPPNLSLFEEDLPNIEGLSIEDLP